MYVSLASFVIILCLYYSFIRRKEFDFTFVFFFYLVILCSQFSTNAFTVYDKCQGSDNLGDAFSITFMPWFFIFGVLYAVLLFAPPAISEGLKAPFSNVIGYFLVSGEANELLNNLLVDPNVSKSLETSQEANKTQLITTSQVILKILGNKAILINEITPSNFEMYWQTLIPLMEKEQTDPQNPLKQTFHDLILLATLHWSLMYCFVRLQHKFHQM